MPIDDQGTDVEALERTLADLRAEGITPKFIYTIPTFQNPTGATTTLERRKRIIELAHSTAPSSSRTMPTLASATAASSSDALRADDRGTTLYFGTPSKTLVLACGSAGWLIPR